MEVQRHRTAIKRYKLSKPVKLLIQENVLGSYDTFFDFGCGHGQDIDLLSRRGYQASGFDPHFLPDNQLISSDIVNLGYVLNVIEKPRERTDTLKQAYRLAKRALCVSVMPPTQQGNPGTLYRDGCVTTRGTFQKYFGQSEFRDYLVRTLGKEPVPLDRGIFLVFKSELSRQQFLRGRSSRYGTPKSSTHSMLH